MGARPETEQGGSAGTRGGSTPGELSTSPPGETLPASSLSAWARAVIYMGLGDKEQAFAWLDKAYVERDWEMRDLKSFSPFDSLRSDPRFTRLLKQMHLE